MLLKEKGDLVSIINKFFINNTKNLNLKEDPCSPSVTLEDILQKIIFYQSIDKIRETYECNKKSSFQQVTEKHGRQVILSINDSKATPVGDTSADMLKVTLNLSLIMNIINLSFENGCFSDDLKLAEVSSIFKKNNDLGKENNRSVSVLFNVSKVFERIIYINAFMQDKLSNLLTGFRKNHSIPHCLMYMLEIWKNILEKGGYLCAMFMDLSKTQYTII